MANDDTKHDVQKHEAPTPTRVERASERPVFVPATDIYETEGSVVLLADMPGVDDKSVDVNLEKGVLTLRGHVEPKALEGRRLQYAEYRLGDYERSFTLSDEVDGEKINATLKHGVLRLELPKKDAAKPRKIEVKVG